MASRFTILPAAIGLSARSGRIPPLGILACVVIVAVAVGWEAYQSRPRRIAEVEPGAILRGAWQSPEALRSLIASHGIRTVVTLTAINRDDPKYRSQQSALQDQDVTWILVPMRGSAATPEQMAATADLIADPARQPVFFHCVGGHHRSSLVHAAYLIRHCGWSAHDARTLVAKMPWAIPEQLSDQRDFASIENFMSWNAEHPDPVHTDMTIVNFQKQNPRREP